MKTTLSLLMIGAVLLLPACSNIPVQMKGEDGKTQIAHATLVGGKGTLSYDAQGRPKFTYNNEKTLLGLAKEIRNGVIGVAAIHGTTNIQNSNNTKDVTNNKNNLEAANKAKEIDAAAAHQKEVDTLKSNVQQSGYIPNQ